ncbi:MAG: hypothetical protein GKR87_03150 [Kiritimatiellae bacterium]|nr:hypothetical protein [Kiritimatiellia bacterium]
MYDTDAAGILYFTHQLRIAHEAFEAFLRLQKNGIQKMLKEEDYLLPVVHSKADYQRPLFLDDTLCIELSVGRIGRASFTTHYKIIKDETECAGTVKIVHASIDQHTRKTIPIPESIRTLISKLTSKNTDPEI